MILDSQRDSLIQMARESRQNAYVPYSNYAVGAAVLMKSGRIFTGVNVENASYGLTVCAERIAIFKAVSEGEREILAIAVSTDNAGSPCGACRQVMVEFAGNVPVYLLDAAGNVHEITLYYLLPEHFGPKQLGK